MKRVALAATWALVWSFALSARNAEPVDEYRAAVRRLMDITGAAQIGTQQPVIRARLVERLEQEGLISDGAR